MPLEHTNLEVLGAGVYWLAPGYDLQDGMAAIPEVKTLVLLVPLPGYQTDGIEHVKAAIIPADPGDLSEDAAAHFLHLTSGREAPVVVASLPGALGAAFFKGVYLMANRDLRPDAMLKEIEPELEEAGSARDEIIHRLIRLDIPALK